MVRVIRDNVRVRVPASSANLGPGYDSMGIALGLYNEVRIEAITGDTVVEVTGESADAIPRGEKNLVVQSVRQGLDAAGAPQVGLRMFCTNHIPHGRGLGSSASAIVSGLMLARGLIDDVEALSDEVILDLATAVEGHPDNVAPTIYGGATIAWVSDRAHAVPLEVNSKMHPTVFVPDFHLATERARAAIPPNVPHVDAVFNATRTALLVQALRDSPELLLEATADRLHQNYRQEQMPSSIALVQWMREHELPAVISGAGPTVMVLGDVPAEIKAEARNRGWNVHALELETEGAMILD